jgi:purine-binding chemotaxis protein CheW
MHLVSFLLNREEFDLDISQFQEIIKLSGWTRVPNAPRYVKGVINLRGRIIPVVDPKLKMGLQESPLDSRDARIIIVEAGGRVIGMAVDSVSQVLRLPSSVVEPPPDTVTGVDDGYIKGVGKLSGRIIILLNVEKVLGKDEKAA